MTNYETLGLRPIINACATLTRLGGSRMPPEVLAAMQEAAQCFIDLNELQRRAGARIAELTGNEAAYLCTGAAAGLVLTTAACITGDDPAAIRQLPDLTGLKNEVILHRTQRNGYDFAVRQVGVRVVEIGDRSGTTRTDLETAITSRTAAIFWFAGALSSPGDLPLPEVISVARAHGIPVIVDAAAQLPPVSSLWDFTRMGAAAAVFSGGKDLRGPQCSGLIVGEADLLRVCAMHGSPNALIGRPMKIGKEEMMGLLAAVERYLTIDQEARAADHERIVAGWNDALNALPGVTAVRDFPNEAGQPLPWSLVTLDPAVAGKTALEVTTQLAEGVPSIAVAGGGRDGFHLNPMTLEPGEERIVLSRLLEILRS
ncbi:MAG: aminotransferase class V-fold PLP-dependent enzyme [Capsulimonadales bacterium]|nr:aminotransferase class V-fold PLP-dependent enzyme [Capsulimonadales bacterium]